MEAHELILVHVFTFAIFVLSTYLFSLLFRRYRENLLLPSLFLSLYFLSLAIYYFFIFLLRFPTEGRNLALLTRAVPLGAFVPDPFLPLFGSLFASFTMSPKKGKFMAFPIVGAALFSMILIILNPPITSVGSGGFLEWVVPQGASTAIWIDISLSLLVVGYLLSYTLMVHGKRDRIKGILLSIAFALLTYLVHYEENFGSGSVLYVRRVLILLSLLILYLGFVMPDWFAKRLKL